MDAATDLVLSLSRLPVSPGRRRRAEEAIGRGVDWDLVFLLAARWYVEPLVLSNLRHVFGAQLPAGVRERAAATEQEVRVRVLSRTLMLVDLCDRLKAVGVSPMALKGPTISIAAYGDASLRYFSDVDLLVKRADVAAARDLLLRNGYAPDYDLAAEATLLENEHALEFSSSVLKVELHCSLMSRHLRFDLKAEDVRGRRVSLVCAGSSIDSLAVPDIFLFMCAHGTKHEWERLSWICDVAQLAERLTDDDSRMVDRLARETNAVRLVTLALHTVREVYGEINSRLTQYIPATSSKTTRLVEDVIARLGIEDQRPPQSWPTRLDSRLRPLLFWSRARERPVDRVASLARVIFLPTENDSGPAGARWFTRPIRLALRALRNVVSQNSLAA